MRPETPSTLGLVRCMRAVGGDRGAKSLRALGTGQTYRQRSQWPTAAQAGVRPARPLASARLLRLAALLTPRFRHLWPAVRAAPISCANPRPPQATRLASRHLPSMLPALPPPGPSQRTQSRKHSVTSGAARGARRERSRATPLLTNVELLGRQARHAPKVLMRLTASKPRPFADERASPTPPGSWTSSRTSCQA